MRKIFFFMIFILAISQHPIANAKIYAEQQTVSVTPETSIIDDVQPEKQEEFKTPSLGKLVLNVSVSLIVVVLCIYGLIYFLRRTMGSSTVPNSLSGFKILSRHPLDSKKAVYLIEVFNRIIVVGVGEHEITLLSEFADKESVKSFNLTTTENSKFSDYFNFGKLSKGRDGDDSKDILTTANDTLKNKIKGIKKIANKIDDIK